MGILRAARQSAGEKFSKRRDAEMGGENDSELFTIMKYVAQTMKFGSGPMGEPSSSKRSSLGDHRKAATEILMGLLTQRKTLKESGLDSEDPDFVGVIDAEI